ncbi:MAG: hypothetical protein COA79_01555 [Planctomycetota bacterium]|nr:MAG: hypothetical protein COA79_01555 [Planctomycetota bacterium]
MSQDITFLLEKWKFDPKSRIRKIEGDNGRPKIQIRVDQGGFQGIMQMELEGRPDGLKPFGYDFYLDYYKNRLKEFVRIGDVKEFLLNRRDCVFLFDESFRIYSRYIFLLELEDYSRVVRDTERNMEIFRFVHENAGAKDDRNRLERWWPYILRINAIARVMIATNEDDYDRAYQIISEIKSRIESLEIVDAHEFHLEKKRSLDALIGMEKDIKSKIPLSEIEVLKKDLADAVNVEDYEKAAQLRDAIHDKEH